MSTGSSTTGATTSASASSSASSTGASSATAGVAPAPSASSAPSSSSTSSAVTTTTTTTTSPPPTPPLVWNLTPGADAIDVSPVGDIGIAVTDGTLQSVTLTNADGEDVAGAMAADSLSWKVGAELGYGKTYTLAATAVDKAGATAQQNYSFTTLTPDNQTKAVAFPTDGMAVGVGQPIDITFDEPVGDKLAIQQMITIKTTPSAVEGAFYWISDTEVHWRPKEYWPAYTHVDVAVMIYGKDTGNGVYGQEDTHFAFDIGPARVARIDDQKHNMVVYLDDKVIADIPVSLGQDRYPTYNGIHVVAEKYEAKIMDSSTWGLTGPGAYRTNVEWATRISSSGEFVHAAPWSETEQGFENVSHGCVNVSQEWGKWFYDNFTYGDIVDIWNTSGPNLEVWDGYGDWQVPWETYKLGGAV